jgi:hypothetical protein
MAILSEGAWVALQEYTWNFSGSIQGQTKAQPIQHNPKGPITLSGDDAFHIWTNDNMYATWNPPFLQDQ